MAKKIKFPLEMRDGVQARTLEELQENFDIEKAMGYLVDGKLCVWLEDRYYMTEAETIRNIDAHAEDAKERLCAALGVEMESNANVDVAEIERRRERLAKLKKYTDDESLWEKVDQVAFDQEDLADLLDENCKEIFLCANKFQIPYSIGNTTYRGIGEASVFVNATGDINLEEKKIYIENIQILNENIETAEQLYQKGLEYKWARNGREYNREKALEYLKKAADKGHPEAIGRFCGAIWNEEDDMKRYGETKYSLLKKIEGAVHKGGQYALGLQGALYYTGQGYGMDEKKGESLIREAAERGDAAAIENLYRLAPKEERYLMLQKGVKLKSAYCANMLGRGYEEGWWGLSVDKEEAKKYYLMSMDFEENGEPDEGWAYYNYAYDYSDNVQEKISYLQKGANERYKHKESVRMLGNLYFMGEEVETDYKKAYHYYELGSKWGDGYSTFGLGRCIYEGKGIEKNLKNGFDKMFVAAKEDLVAVRDYAISLIKDNVNSNVENAYIGKDGYYFIVKEAIDSIFSNYYVFYYISYDNIFTGRTMQRKVGNWEMETTVYTSSRMLYLEGAVYCAVSDGSRGAFFRINDEDKSIYKIREFREEDSTFFVDVDQSAGVIHYGSHGAGEYEYKYK